MDLNTFIDAGVALLTAVIGWYTKSIDRRIDRVEVATDERATRNEAAFATRVEKVDAAFDELPNRYARRDDMKDFIKAVFERLDRIEGKIDHKADR
jgi:hypothetical protein